MMIPSVSTTSIALGAASTSVRKALLCLAARRHVMRGAAQEHGGAALVAIDPAARPHPPQAPVRQDDPEVPIEIAAALIERGTHVVLDRGPVVGMDAAQKAAEVDALVRLIAEQDATLACRPDFISRDAPFPQSQLTSTGGELQTVLALAQLVLAFPQAGIEPGRRDHIPAEVVSHRGDHTEKSDRHGCRNSDQAIVEQRREDRPGKHEKQHAPAYHCGSPPCVGIAATPQPDGSVGYEGDEQQVAQLGDDDVRIGDANRYLNAFAARYGHREHRCHLLEVDVDPGAEVEQQRYRPQAAGRVSQPRPARAEVPQNEADEGQEENEDRHVGPTQGGGVLVCRAGPHHAQLEQTESRDCSRSHEEQQVSVLAPLAEPDQQVDETEGEARCPDHRPGHVDPSHRSRRPGSTRVLQMAGATSAGRHKTRRHTDRGREPKARSMGHTTDRCRRSRRVERARA
jgi:hypothetical protein